MLYNTIYYTMEESSMPKHTIKENVSITYADDKINIVGKTFEATLFVTQSSLMGIYMGNQGTGTSKLTINIPEPKANTSKPK